MASARKWPHKQTRDETIAMSDASLYIPIDTMESLNVGVAAGIVMYTFKGGSL